MTGREYVRGPTYARRRTPRFEFKPSATGYTGGGYARIRSTERREHTPGDGAEDVFVSVHRLCAVAWKYPDSWSVGEILNDMDGKDVHHQLGMPSANLESELEVIEHGRHSGVTNTQIRAWAEDAKRAAESGGWEDDECPECGAEVDGDGATVGTESGLCIECATEKASGRDVAIEL